MNFSSSPLAAFSPEPLSAVAEFFTPVAGDFPSAGESDPGNELLCSLWEWFPREQALILDALRSIEGPDVSGQLDLLSRQAPIQFEALRSVFVVRYLSTASVWGKLGYPGHVPAPPIPGEAEYMLRGNLLDAVIARGPIYQLPPADQAEGGHGGALSR